MLCARASPGGVQLEYILHNPIDLSTKIQTNSEVTALFHNFFLHFTVS